MDDSAGGIRVAGFFTANLGVLLMNLLPDLPHGVVYTLTLIDDTTFDAAWCRRNLCFYRIEDDLIGEKVLMCEIERYKPATTAF